jgi:hypothetical protein
MFQRFAIIAPRGVLRVLVALSALGGAGLVTASCASDGTTTAPTTSSVATTTMVPSTTTTGSSTATTMNHSTTTTGSSTATPFYFVPMQTATGGEFYSPSKNISCEINSGSTVNGTLCLAIKEQRAVWLTSEGTLKTCSGPACMSNAGIGTPVLPYGSATGVGPFRCLSETSGMRCTTTNGKGFTISSSATTPIGGAVAIPVTDSTMFR